MYATSISIIVLSYPEHSLLYAPVLIFVTEVYVETLRGIIIDIIFQNDESGFKICELETDDDVVVIKGILPFLEIGEKVRVDGVWTTHDFYGEQFNVNSFEIEIPKAPEEIEAFLSSGLIYGIGNVTASLIVNSFGEDTYDIILNAPEKLAEIKGISHNKAMKIAEGFKEHFQMSDIVAYFNKYGLTAKLAIKAYKIYGETALSVVQRNPYILINDIPEVGFKTADKIGKSIGFATDSSMRIGAGIIHCLKQALQFGHVYVPYDILLKESTELLHVSTEVIAKCIEELATISKIIVDYDEKQNKIIYISYMYNCEKYIADRLISISDSAFIFDEKNFNTSIEQFADVSGYELDENQISAIKQAGENGLTVITGGPGTGKTTIIRALVHFFTACRNKCVLAAPTGRAAKRMSESCGYQAKTIHRLLEFSGDESDDDSSLKFKRDENNPIEADVVIIDELSMVDSLLMYHLLKALPDNVRLVLVGDKDQLPSVGAGNVLRDIIASERFSVVTLSIIYRRENESLISVNAHRINMGEMPVLNTKEGDFFIISRNKAEECADTVVELVTKRLPDAYGINPLKDIQVLIPSKKGPVGSINTNALLQEKLNAPGELKKEIELDNVVYRKGDRVMQIKNNYNIRWYKQDRPEQEGEGIFNGEMGEILYINDKARELVVLFDDDRCATYNFTEVRQLEHCYAITVHKSQGSEFPYCIIPLVGNPPMLMTRNILYTAITRAKKMVVIVGTRDHIKHMIENDRQQLRFTGLCKMIKSYENN